MAITLNFETASAIKAMATAENSAKPFETSALIVFVPVSSVAGLSTDIEAVIPNSTKAYAIAVMTEDGAVAYLEDTAERAADTMQEISYNLFEATYC